MAKAMPAPLAKEWRSAWSPGWTSIVTLQPGAQAAGRTQATYLTYYSGNGSMQIGRIREPGRGPDSAWDIGRQGDWTTVVPFRAHNRSYYLGYSSHMGWARIERIDGRERRIATVWRANWGSGWMSIVPFSMQGRAHFLVYRPSDGNATIDQFDPQRESLVTLWDNTKAPWETGWTSIVPFSLDGWPHYLAYRNRDGLVVIGRFAAHGQGAERVWDNDAHRWERGWAWFAPFAPNGQTCFLKYRMSDGAIAVDRVRSGGRRLETRWSGGWSPGVTALAPFSIDGAPFLLAYNRASGAVGIDRFTWSET
jgi:hypothetical protein